MERLSLVAPAKLNLRLLVGPLAGDGYHPVRTLMVALEGVGDRVQVTRADTRSVRCPGVDGPANLAWRALDALEREVGRPLPVEVVIEKSIPAQAGLGGGSSDAAATLVAVDRLFEIGLGEDGLERVAAAVGADVPFFIRGGAQWGEGRGDRLTPGRTPPFAALLLRPDVGLATADVYRAFDRLPAPAAPPAVDTPSDFAGLASWVRNDLWAPALSLRPVLGRTARVLAALGARPVVLCGSGTCVAGLFPDLGSARNAADRSPVQGFCAVVRPSVRGVRPATD